MLRPNSIFATKTLAEAKLSLFEEDKDNNVSLSKLVKLSNHPETTTDAYKPNSNHPMDPSKFGSLRMKLNMLMQDQ